MIQYDRTTRAFSPQEGVQSQAVLEISAKLNEAIVGIRTWLNLKRGTGRYAHGFLVELAVNSMSRLFHIHAIYDEIGKLEGTDTIPSMTKKPRQMRAPLRGLWHKHYFQASFIPRNLSDEAEQMSRDGRWKAMIAPHYGKYLHEVIGKISHEMVIGAYERRARDRRITGEFIVYERQADGSNCYLTLGKHGEWDAIRARVEAYKKFGVIDDSIET